MIPLGDWKPDLPPLENTGATVARNVFPRTGAGYEPVPALTALSPALTSYCRGVGSMTDTAGVVYTFAGDGTKLYQVDATAAVDVSIAGGYTLVGDDRWEIVKWGNTCIATGWTDPVQTLALGGANFSNLIVSTLKPKAKHVAISKDNFVVLGYTNDAVDGNQPSRVWWSAQNDPTDFQPSASTQCDNQDLQGNGGAVQRVVSMGEYMAVFTRRSIWRMTYVGGAPIFQFDEVEQARGTPAPGSVLVLGRMAFYLADDGFYVFDGSSSTPIGGGKVDRTFLAELSDTYKYSITCAVDPARKLIVWAYATSASIGNGVPDKMIAFNWATGRWSDVVENVEVLFQALGTGITLDGLDAVGYLDQPLVGPVVPVLQFSLDSEVWAGGGLQFGGFTSAHRLGAFDGPNMAATIETGEFQVIKGQRSMVTEVMPIVDGGVLTMALGTRNIVTAAASFGTASAIDAYGRCLFLSNARYHRARVSVAAAGTWTHAQGIDNIKATPQGQF